MSNCPYTQDRLFHAIETLTAIRVNQDCAIELDRLNTPDKCEILDDLASAVAYATQAHERLTTSHIGYHYASVR